VVDCGPGNDTVKIDSIDVVSSCETVNGKPGGTATPTPPRPVATKLNAYVVRSKGKLVLLPGARRIRIDSRLVPDANYLRSKFHVAFTRGSATELDMVPGQGGSWTEVDRLAGWVQTGANRPRPPFREVAYSRGSRLHLGWIHSAARRGRTPQWVEVFTKEKPPTYHAGGADLRGLARVSNAALGHPPHVRSGLSASARCQGAGPLVPTFKAAAKSFGLSWKILAAITQVESSFGCDMGPSSAGAIGWTQFMPATWKEWGMDADGNGKADPYNSVDAIFSTARYLRANGAPGNYRRAIYAYNHAGWYVTKVLQTSRSFKTASQLDALPVPKQPLSVTQLNRVQTVR
jgi:hypothetical protein